MFLSVSFLHDALLKILQLKKNTYSFAFEMKWQFVLCSSCTGWHLFMYTNRFRICLLCVCLRVMEWLNYWLIDWLMDRWMAGWMVRCTNDLTGRCLCCGASEIYSITQNAWPAYTVSFHMNYTEQTSHYNFVLHVSFKRSCRKENRVLQWTSSQLHTVCFCHKLSLFAEV